MKPTWWSYARNGLVALGIAGAISAPAAASPAGSAGDYAARAATQLPLQQTQIDRGGLVQKINHLDMSDRNFNRNHYWKRRHFKNRRHIRRNIGPSIYFGLGLVPAYRYVDPTPNYIAPRRLYRAQGMGQSHVNWCYARYKSYRAWDNTFQPFNGPRQQCWSPYS